MKKVLAVVLSVLMIMPFGAFCSFATDENVWDGTVSKSFAAGTGTSDDPYIIETAGQLAYLAKAVANGTTFSGKHVKLANDVCLNDTSNWEDWDITPPANVWTPIGNSAKLFKGNFEGDNKIISGLYVSDVDYAGLFGYSEMAIISNVVVKESYIQSTETGYAGGVVAFFNDNTNSPKGLISGCANYATVLGNITGGVCGRANGIVVNCSNLGNVIGVGEDALSGGIVGEYDSAKNASISQCFNGGVVDGKISGGIVGCFYPIFMTGYVCNAMGYCNHPLQDIYATINNCYNLGEIKSEFYSGGIVGKCNSASSFTSVAISERCVQFSYNVGVIESDGVSGQIIGKAVYDDSTERKVLLNKSYYYNPVPTIQYALGGTSSDSGYAVSLSNEKAQLQESYTNLDFNTVWTMSGSASYPYPELIDNPHISKHEHSYTSEVTTPATHTSTGVMTYTCDCGDSYTEAIDKTPGHTYTATVTPPFCDDEGYTTYTCECGDSYVADYTDALGHCYTSKVTTPATHTSTGVMTYTCDCGDSYTETIEKIAEHSYASEITTPATHTSTGVMTYTCECGDSYTETIEKIAEHSYDSKITTPATHTSTGVMTYTCECGDSYTETIEKTAEHSYSSVVTDPTCTEQGYTTYTCACGDSYVSDYVDALGHTDGEWTVTKPATTTATGTKTQSCSVCGEVIRTETIQMLPAKVYGVSVSDVSLDYKATATITPAVNADNGAKYTVSYSSSDPSVANVDANGKVTATGTGNATITCTVKDTQGNTVTDTCEVKVSYNWWQWIIVIVLFGWIWY